MTDETLGGAFSYGDERSNIKSYSFEMKLEAVRLHEEERWTYQKIREKYGIQDKDRVRMWMYRYRKHGEYGLMDNRGRREEYKDQNRHIEQLKRENTLLKKCLEIWKRGV